MTTHIDELAAYPAIANMLPFAEAAAEGGWVVFQRDLAVRPEHRVMEGRRGGLWFRLVTFPKAGVANFRIRSITKGAPTFTVDYERLEEVLANPDEVRHDFFSLAGDPLDLTQMVIALRLMA